MSVVVLDEDGVEREDGRQGDEAGREAARSGCWLGVSATNVFTRIGGRVGNKFSVLRPPI